MSTSVKKGHKIGCKMHQCHCQRDNNKKEFDSALGFKFATNLRPKSLVNDRKNQCTGGQMMVKTTRTCSPMDPNKLCKLCLAIYEDEEKDRFCMKDGQGKCVYQHHDTRNDGKNRTRSTNLNPKIKKLVGDFK